MHIFPRTERVAGAEKTFDRDLWESSEVVKTLGSPAEVDELLESGKEAIVAVYAPWCQFCQAMEEEFDKFAAQSDVPVYKFRGDEERVYVESKLNTKSFPTVNKVEGGTATKYESEVRTVEAMTEFRKSA